MAVTSDGRAWRISGISDYREELGAKSGAFTTIDGGEYSACAARADGGIECWPSPIDDPDGYLNINAPKTGEYVQLAVTDHYACGLDVDGKVRCWWPYRDGVATTRDGVYSDIAMSSYSKAYTACALDAVPRLPECWNIAWDIPPAVPMLDIARLQIGSCAVLEDHTLTCVGYAGIPPAGDWYERVDCNHDVCCSLDTFGEVTCWHNYPTPSAIVDEVPPGPFVDVSVGWYHACALDPAGEATCWPGDWPVP
jgi:hypothetical protein